jgi:hypothetical protein
MSGTLKRTILLGAAVAALLGAGSCGRNRAGLLLAPSGTPPGPPAIAAITGVLDFGTPAPHPPVQILVARVRGAAPSSYASMEMTGSFTTPTWTPGGAGNPKFTQLAPKVWVDTLVLVTGEMQWKFVGNASWASAFCSVLSGTDVDGLAGSTKFDAGGGKNLVANVAATEAGICVCTMDENSDPPTYEIEKVGPGAPAVYSGTDGRFTITGLVAGTYNLLFRVPGQTPFTMNGIVVGNAMKDLGTISTSGQTYTVRASAGPNGVMVPTGDLTVPRGENVRFSLAPWPHYRVADLLVDGVSVGNDTAYTLANVTADHTVEASFAYNTAVLPGGIRATLAFDPFTLPITTAPYPPVTAKLYWGTVRLDSLLLPASDDALDLADLDRASYRLVLSSPLYTTLDLPVTVGGGVTDLGILNMTADFNLLASAIHVAGDFNGWSTSALSAEIGGDLAWSVSTTTPITAGVHDLKFARYGSFVDPAYGGDPATTLDVPVVNRPTRLVSGGGTSTNAIRVNFPTTANYTFTLDERRQVFSIQQAVTAATSGPRR